MTRQCERILWTLIKLVSNSFGSVDVTVISLNQKNGLSICGFSQRWNDSYMFNQNLNVALMILYLNNFDKETKFKAIETTSKHHGYTFCFYHTLNTIPMKSLLSLSMHYVSGSIFIEAETELIIPGYSSPVP